MLQETNSRGKAIPIRIEELFVFLACPVPAGDMYW